MGRPLNKKYFGNRNIGTTGTGDDGLGGTAVASVTLNALGAYTTRPTITFSDPDLLGIGGVRATGTITSEVESVTAVGGTQTGYTVGQLVTVDGTDAVLRVATIGGTGGDDALTFDFTGGSRGNFTTLPTGAQTTTSNGAGAGLTVTLRFRAKAVVITNQGSGYSHAADATASFTQSVTATSVNMLVDTGIISTAGNQENAIRCYAKTTSGGTRLIGDIIKQVSTNRYKVKTADGISICKLVTDGSTGYGKMDITAYDTGAGGSNEYWVTKLTSRTVTLVSKGGGAGGTDFTNGKQVKWTFGSAVAPSGANIGVAQIQNS